MRRSTTLLLSLPVILALTLAACGGDDADSADDLMPGTDMGQDMGPDGGMGHGETSPVAEGARRVEVTATSFAFDPDEITITAGEDIAIVLTSDDVEHDFTVDELDAHVSAEVDETEEGGLRSEEPGEYTYYCTVSGHREAGMEGTLIVEAP